MIQFFPPSILVIGSGREMSKPDVGFKFYEKAHRGLEVMEQDIWEHDWSRERRRAGYL